MEAPRLVPRKRDCPTNQEGAATHDEDEMFIIRHRQGTTAPQAIPPLPPSPETSPPHLTTPQTPSPPSPLASKDSPATQTPMTPAPALEAPPTSPTPPAPPTPPSAYPSHCQSIAPEIYSRETTPTELSWSQAAAEETVCHNRKGRQDEEQDQGDDEAFEEEIARGPDGKGKGRAMKKGEAHPGCISDQVKAQAFAIQEEYELKMEALAAEAKKPVQTLYSLVGSSPKPFRRCTSGWGAWEAWYKAHGDHKKTNGMSAQEWNGIVASKYNDLCKEKLGDNWQHKTKRLELFQPYIKWYMDKFGELVEAKKEDWSFTKLLSKTRDEFIHLGHLAYEYYGVHCFGFIVDIDPDNEGHTGSAMWGSTAAFEPMKKKEKIVISSQIANWESLIRVAHLQLNGMDVDPKLLFPVNEHMKPGEKWRDHIRQVFVEWLRADMGKILLERGAPLERCQNIKMPWVNWPNVAYDMKMRIVNWPISARAPNGSNYDIKKGDTISNPDMSSFNCAREYSDTEESSIRIVSWDKDEMELELNDPALHDIVLVTNSRNIAIVEVSDSSKYRENVQRYRDPSRKNKKLPKSLVPHKRFIPSSFYHSDDDKTEGGNVSNNPSTRDKRPCSADDAPLPARKQARTTTEARSAVRKRTRAPGSDIEVVPRRRKKSTEPVMDPKTAKKMIKIAKFLKEQGYLELSGSSSESSDNDDKEEEEEEED
ncbi:hypothetical protein C0991_012592 [Blastosporella zonata]|nr:hypothetical protein C0991_012592 [Blastosporella zonata]